ncbi:MAG: hypothetical protein GEU90_09175 [Gemmatimonas sp.]|nr:hypothetical protein [Gemmatimonas sp.]
MPNALRTDPISRDEWGSEHGRGDLDPGAEKRVVIHHSFRPALEADATPDEERAAVLGIERFHVESNGWAGIGYNWLVAPSGRIYEGRGWKFKGAHAGPVNGESIGVCLLIDGSQTDPSDRSIAAIRDLIADGVALGEISPDYVLSGHRDHMDRTCPGDKVYARLQAFRHDAGGPRPEVVARPEAHPAEDDTLRLDKIEIPRREHVDLIARQSHLSADAIGPGLRVAELLLRGVGAAAGARGRGVPTAVADALAAWRRGRSQDVDETSPLPPV